MFPWYTKKSRFDRSGCAEGLGSRRARSMWRYEKHFARRLVNNEVRSSNLDRIVIG